MTAPVFFVGIDPGRKGAVAVVDAAGKLVSVVGCDTLDVDGLSAISTAVDTAVKHGRVLAAVEDSKAFGLGSKQSLMTQGYGMGMAVAAAALMGAEVCRPSGKEWKTDLVLSSDKDASRNLAFELFGQAPFMNGKRAARADLAEAALIAYWLFKQHETSNE